MKKIIESLDKLEAKLDKLIDGDITMDEFKATHYGYTIREVVEYIEKNYMEEQNE